MSKEQTNPHWSGDSQAMTPEALQRELHIQYLLDQLQELAGGQMIMGKLDRCPPEVFETFLEEVLEFEREYARKKRKK